MAHKNFYNIKYESIKKFIIFRMDSDEEDVVVVVVSLVEVPQEEAVVEVKVLSRHDQLIYTHRIKEDLDEVFGIMN